MFDQTVDEKVYVAYPAQMCEMLAGIIDLSKEGREKIERALYWAEKLDMAVIVHCRESKDLREFDEFMRDVEIAAKVSDEDFGLLLGSAHKHPH